MAQLPADSNFDRIQRFYQDPIANSDELTEEQKTLLMRWECAHRFLYDCNGRNQKVVAMLIKQYGISDKTAYRDIANAKKLFSLNQPWDAKFNRNLLWEINMRLLEGAEVLGDYRASAAIAKNLERLNQEKGDPDMPDWKIFQFNQIVISPNPEDIGMDRVENVDELLQLYKTKKKTIELNGAGQ